MRKFLAIVSVMTFIVSFFSATPAAAGGFDEFGYNRQARVFVGPASGWCLEKNLPANCLGIYSNDHLVMKWNAEWDRGNAEGWTDPKGYGAWLDNQWNGRVPGGSGWTEHFKARWYGSCGADYAPIAGGGYCIWGIFQVLMDHGQDPDRAHWWLAHAIPNGYGRAP